MAAKKDNFNDNLILICGEPIAGKSVSLMNIEKPEGVMYLNCENGKKLPFKSKFKQYTIVDPFQVHDAFIHAEKKADIHTIVIDSLTFLMEMFHSKYIHNSADGMTGWANYQHFFKTMLQQHVASSTKDVVFTAHVQSVLNEKTMEWEKKVPVQGSLNKNGLEAYFSCIVTAKKKSLDSLEGFNNSMLTITPQDEALGFKHVFQTQVTKETIGERMRSPMGMFSVEETYTNNDVQLIFNRLHEYYN